MRLVVVFACASMLAACHKAEPDIASMDSDEALKECRVSFNDFTWRHEFSGTIIISGAPVGRKRLKPEQLACMDKWASSNSGYIFVAGYRPIRRSAVVAKARNCGLVPERDLVWTGSAQRQRASISNQVADMRAAECLLDWANYTGAAVSLDGSKT